MRNIAYIANDNGITAVINGETMTITSDNPTFGQVLEALKDTSVPAEVVAGLFRTANAVKRYLKGKVSIDEGSSTVTYEGEELDNVIVDRILQFMSDGLPVDPLIALLERLMANPSRRAIQELYKFLEHKSMPITEDGCFLAYKGVNEHYMDMHTGTFDNSVGTVNEMPRSKVDDDFRVGCSYGFHVGSLEYATGFGPVTVIVKVDPADVVSVPEDCGCQKLRTAKYEVIAEYQGAINAPLVNTAAPYTAFDFDDLD